jgi:hypothetical protein
MSKLLELINNLKDFDKICKVLKNEPYYGKIKWSKNLYLISYSDQSDKDNEIVQEMNGIILEKNTNKVIANCTKIIKEKTFEEFDDNFTTDHEKYLIDEIDDGTNIRFYYYNNKWNIATNKNINAYYGYWYHRNKSFGEMVDEYLDKNKGKFYKILDKQYTYFYTLTHPDNYMIIKYLQGELKFLYKMKEPYQLELPKVNEEDHLYSKEYLKLFLKNSKNDKRGIVVINKENSDIIKYDKDSFTLRKEIRGDTFTIQERYIELFLSGDNEKIELLKKYFPKGEYRYTDFLIKKFILVIMKKYYSINRFHIFTKLNKFEKQVVFELHNQYKNEKSPINEKLIKRVLYKNLNNCLEFLFSRKNVQKIIYNPSKNLAEHAHNNSSN